MTEQTRDELIAEALPWVSLQSRLLAKPERLARQLDDEGSVRWVCDEVQRLTHGLDVMEAIKDAPEPSEQRRAHLRRLWTTPAT